jgi:hypothetical protein
MYKIRHPCFRHAAVLAAVRRVAAASLAEAATVAEAATAALALAALRLPRQLRKKKGCFRDRHEANAGKAGGIIHDSCAEIADWWSSLCAEGHAQNFSLEEAHDYLSLKTMMDYDLRLLEYCGTMASLTGLTRWLCS